MNRKVWLGGWIVCLVVSIGCEGNELTTSQDEHLLNVTFTNGAVTLAGTLHFPQTPGPHPAIVTVHGSGKQTRRNHNYISDYLVPRGIAVLNYDKRGVGDSQGEYTGVGPGNSVSVFDDLSGDALAAVEFLRSQESIDSKRIGLLGVSQAGWIIPLAAARSTDVAFMVLLSGPTVTVGEEIYYSDLTGDQGESTGMTVEEASEKTRSYSGPHGFDPVPSLEAVDVPGLWLFGTADRSIPVSLCVEILDDLVEKYQKNFTVISYPGANHALRDSATGARAPTLQDIFNWLAELLRLQK